MPTTKGKTATPKRKRRKRRTNLTKKEKECVQAFMKKEMGDFKRGKMKSGSGKKITNRRQAIAVSLKAAAQECYKKKKKT